jgi:hypothetical protein
MSKATEMIVKAKHLNANNVTYKAATVDSRGGKKVQIQLNGQALVISAPMMFTWGVNERVDESSGRVSYDANLVFESDKSSSVATFCKNMKGLQEKLLNDAVKNSKEWFGKSKMSKEVAEAMMYPILKYPKDKISGEPDYSRNPSMKLKLPFWENKFNLELYDTQSRATFLPTKDGCEGPQGNKTPVDLVPSRSYIKGLIACNGLWMAGGRFGVTWKLVQAQVRPPVRLVGTGVCHLEADSDDDEMLESVQKEEQEEDSSTSLPHFDDSAEDDEEEDEEEVKPETPPAPKKKKKVVRRKKTKSSA